MNKKINICLIQPAMSIHTMALLEAAIYLGDLGRQCGTAVEIHKNRFLHDALNIVLGAHLLPAGVFPPPGSVIFNCEQLANKDAWFQSSHYASVLERHTVWDYSRANLGNIPHDQYSIIPFLYCARLNTIRRTSPAHDIIFYGSLNDRRRNLLNSLGWMADRVDVLCDIYGPERDARLAQARAVLNIHFYDTQILEQVRCFHALSNGIPVITEDYPADSAPAAYRDCLHVIPADISLSDYVRTASADGWAGFSRASEEKFARFKTLSALPEFSVALDAALTRAASRKAESPAVAMPRKLHLGSGKDYRQGCLNVDINPAVGPDIVLDLAAALSFPLSFDTATHGRVTLEEGCFDEIIANDVLEHVPDLTSLMGNCLKLLRVGGVFRISVPYDLGLGAWQDPTHVRAFNQNSWLYFCDWSWYLGWLDYRFEVANNNVVLSDLGKALVQRGAATPDVLNTPRAVESMQVELVKRATTPEERQLTRAFDSRFCMNLEL